ncbi:hypothetical protein ANCCEY_03359 [Ancylostoma ceylanicum]|uniref:PXA domain-containing protein n=1 Tax=Ancylostoma ceylanicum TaxID=53326 RepID=A0A0D6MB90_9BILA|nr:hypothetical protein ANCCEY_03359 [Ancylostoma ceylanicum]
MMIFRVLPIACCLFSLFMGVSIATWIANDSNGRFLYPLVHAWFSKYYAGKEPHTAVSDEEQRSFSWKELKVPTSVNDAVESLLDQLIDTYVNNWYESGISRDRDFLNEIRYQIRFACSQLISKAKALGLPAVVAEDVIPTAALHMHRIIKYEDDLSEKSTWPSQSVRHFLRELIVNALLLPCLDLIADPDTINHLLIMTFDAQKGEGGGAEQLCDSNRRDVSFLGGFTENATQVVPDSLLHLKLSEVLRDARQYSTFRLYLQDTRGPVNELCFLAEASRIHDSMQRKAESSSQIAYDIWQLFGQFVHDSAPDRIEFDPEIVQEFKAAVECNNLPLLEKVVETVSH